MTHVYYFNFNAYFKFSLYFALVSFTELRALTLNSQHNADRCEDSIHILHQFRWLASWHRNLALSLSRFRLFLRNRRPDCWSKYLRFISAKWWPWLPVLGYCHMIYFLPSRKTDHFRNAVRTVGDAKRLISKWQQLQAPALQQAVWGISCLFLLPSSGNDSRLHPSFNNNS